MRRLLPELQGHTHDMGRAEPDAGPVQVLAGELHADQRLTIGT